MTDQQLSERLRAAVPDPPPLDRLAERAVADGRRRRTTKRGAAAAAALVTVVAAALVVPGLLDGEPVLTATSVECVEGGNLTSASDAEGDVVAVRFCGRNDGQTGGLRFPDGALTDGAAQRFVANWPTGDEVCGKYGGRTWQVQVQTSSGDVYQRSGNTEVCADEAAALRLLTGISEALAAGYKLVSAPIAMACPDGLRLDRTNRDGESAELLTADGDSHPMVSTTPLLALPASDGLVCQYAGTGRDRRLVESWRVAGRAAEALRLESMLGYLDGVADCSGDADAASYVVALRDVTGTTRTFSLDGTQCSPMSAAIGTPAEEQYLGLALPGLVNLIEESRP